MNINLDKEFEEAIAKNSDIAPNRCIVRLTTSYWSDKRGIHIKKSITYLKKLCEGRGFDFLEEETSNIGASEVVERITNLNECKDGVYVFDITNESKDWETGYIDDYDYKLIPFKNE